METIELVEADAVIHAKSWKGGSHRNRINNPHKPFIAWDGEGYTDDTGEHHYNLFGCSTGDYEHGGSLDYSVCFDVLLRVASENDAIHVIYAGTYDLVMMIHKLDTKKCKRIMEGKATWVGPYRVQFYRSKWLSISDKQHRHVVLYDVFTFFACPFVKACRQYLGNDDTLDAIAATKTKRSTFKREDLATDIMPYWRNELEYLVKLCESLRERLSAAGIEMSRWHGPGAVATVVLTQQKIKKHLGETPPEITELARHAYYGGRFEQFQLGHYEGKVYQYDINSAYPTHISQLPSLTNVRWRRSEDKELRSDFALYQIRFASGEGYHGCYPLPWRSDKGRIYYPRYVGAPSWYWGIEARNLHYHAGTAKIDVIECWEPYGEGLKERPFSFVNEMYDERLRMKQAGDPAQLAVKLALNSLYGKLAQSKGAVVKDGEWKVPTFHQLIWAGWITAATRAQLYRAICLNPKAVIGVETDAIFSTEPLDLPISSAMGDWSVAEYEGITFIQSGVYFSNGGEALGWGLKSRGFEVANHSHDQWMRVLANAPKQEDAISFTVNRFGSVPGLSNWARWYSFTRETVFSLFDGKRIHMPHRCGACKEDLSLADGLHRLHLPQMFIPSGNISSHPHPLPWSKDSGYAWQNVWDEADFDTFESDLI